MLFSLMLFSELPPPLRHHLRNRTPDKSKFSAGLTPLHVATLNGDTAIAQVLAQSGADATIPVCIQSMHEHHCTEFTSPSRVASFQDAVQGLTPLAMMKQAKLESIIAAASAPKTLKGSVADGSCGGRGRVGIPMR